MIVYLSGGPHEDRDNTKELTFILPKSITIMITRPESGMFGGINSTDGDLQVPIDEYCFELKEVRFDFSEKGRLKVFFGNEEMSNDLYYINFLFNSVKREMANVCIFAGEPFSEAGVPSLTDLHTDYSWYSMKEYEFQLLVQFCEKNGINIDRKFINKITYIILAINPALRELWTPSISLDNIFSNEGLKIGDPHGYRKIPSCLSKKTFKETVHECFGHSSKKLLKMVASRIYKIHQISMASFRMDSASEIHIKKRLETYQISKKDPNILIKQQINMEMLELGSLLKGLVTLDHMYKILENNEKMFIENPVNCSRGRHNNRKLLKMFPVETRIKLLKDLRLFMKNAPDTYIQYKEFKDFSKLKEKVKNRLKEKRLKPIKIPNRWKNIKELHDNISRQYRDIKATTNNLDIEYSPEVWEVLNKAKVGDMTILLPIETAELSKWGKLMSNCIASRGKVAADSSSIILGIYKSNILTYNVEISKNVPLATIGEKQHSLESNTYKYIAFKAAHNKPPEEEDRAAILGYLIEKELLIEEKQPPTSGIEAQLQQLQQRQERDNRMMEEAREQQPDFNVRMARHTRQLIRNAENN